MQNYQIFKFTSYVTDQKLSDILLDPALFGVVLHELETGEQYQCMLQWHYAQRKLTNITSHPRKTEECSMKALHDAFELIFV